MEKQTTHFGFQTVLESEKSEKVAEVFDSVANRYDLMNDLMSLGLHRLWKRFTVAQSGVRAGAKVLDIAGGTADLAAEFARRAGVTGEVWLTDINYSMLTVGRNRLLNEGMCIPVSQCDAENLPFPGNYFDCVSVGFGLRNMTHKEVALREMYRVIKPGGKLLVLEFSKIWQPLRKLYQFYTFKIVPAMGRLLVKDEESYRYLAESIAVHPDQEAIKSILLETGFDQVDYFNLAAGSVALHCGYKF